jgi:hypothetical protein
MPLGKRISNFIAGEIEDLEFNVTVEAEDEVPCLRFQTLYFASFTAR